jgi:hypothetical protein
MSEFKFPTIEDIPIENVSRTLSRQDISQFTELAGANKTITSSDGANVRVLIGYQKDGF